MRLSQYILAGKRRLEEAGLQCADPLLHMKQLVQFALGWDSSALHREWNTELSGDDLRKIEGPLARRLAGEPFQYITGQEEFWSLDFRVGPGVLIPRRETECLVEALLKVETRSEVRCAELGAGTGNIGIALLTERTAWEWHAFERNALTIPYLEQNRAALLPENASYHIHRGDFFSGIASLGFFDWIISNPPYVPTQDMNMLSKEVRHEPREALEGGECGVDILACLLTHSLGLLKEGGGIALEMDYRHGDRLTQLAGRLGYQSIQILPDYARLPRIFMARKG